MARVKLRAGIGVAATDMSLLESSFSASETEKAKSEARELQARVRRSVNAKGCTGWQGELDTVPTLPPLTIQRFCD